LALQLFDQTQKDYTFLTTLFERNLLPIFPALLMISGHCTYSFPENTQKLGRDILSGQFHGALPMKEKKNVLSPFDALPTAKRLQPNGSINAIQEACQKHIRQMISVPQVLLRVAISLDKTKTGRVQFLSCSAIQKTR